MKKIIFGFISLFIFCSILFGLQPAHAVGGWIVNSTHAPYRIDRACRDGIQVTAVVAKQYAPGGEFGDQGGDRVGLDYVYFYNGPFSDELVEFPNIALQKEYLQRIGHQRNFHITLPQSTPIQYAGEDTLLYETTVIPFVKEAMVGGSAIVNNGGELRSDNFGPIEDCRLLHYPADGNHDFDETLLAPAAATGFNPSHISVEIIDAPDTGEIQLNGSAPLAAGSQFTQAALNTGGGEINYVAPATTDSADSFTYSVQGTMRITNGNDDSYQPSITADGGAVAFTSHATNLSLFDTGGNSQVFKYDISSDTLEAISLNEDQDGFGNGRSYEPVIEPHGETIAFTSTSNNMVDTNAFCFRQSDTNGLQDVFLWDRFPTSGQSKIERVSMFYAGFGNPCIEPELISDQPAIADSRANNQEVVFRAFDKVDVPYFDDQNGESDIVAFGNLRTKNVYGVSDSVIIINPTIVATIPPIIIPREGEPVAEQSAPQLTATPTPQTLDAPDLPSSKPAVSADGNVIAYQSFATDLIKTLTNSPSDTNGFLDIYASEWNGSRWVISRISLSSDNQKADGGHSTNPDVSQFGRHIVFESTATNLDTAASTGNAQIYVRDRDASCTTLLSKHTDGTMGNGSSFDASISATGRFVAFASIATNLVDDDTNGAQDIFVVDRDADEDGLFYSDVENCVPDSSRTVRVSVTAGGVQANGASYQPDLSQNGEFVAFTSDATNLVSNDTNGTSDVFVHYLGYTRTIPLSDPDVPAGLDQQIFLPIVVSP